MPPQKVHPSKMDRWVSQRGKAAHFQSPNHLMDAWQFVPAVLATSVPLACVHSHVLF